MRWKAVCTQSWDSFPRQAVTGLVVWHLPIDAQQSPLGAQVPREWNLIWPTLQTLASAADVRIACASVLLLWEQSTCKKWKTVWPCWVTQTEMSLWPRCVFSQGTCPESLNNNTVTSSALVTMTEYTQLWLMSRRSGCYRQRWNVMEQVQHDYGRKSGIFLFLNVAKVSCRELLGEKLEVMVLYYLQMWLFRSQRVPKNKCPVNLN